VRAVYFFILYAQCRGYVGQDGVPHFGSVSQVTFHMNSTNIIFLLLTKFSHFISLADSTSGRFPSFYQLTSFGVTASPMKS